MIRRVWLARIAIAVLCLITFALVAYKFAVLGYVPSDLVPRTQHEVTYELGFDGHDRDVRIRTFLPASDRHQVVRDEQNISPGLQLATQLEGLNRTGTWTATRAPDDSLARYSLAVLTTDVTWEIPPTLEVPAVYPASVGTWLRPEEHIQVDDPEITATLAEIGADQGTVLERLRAIHHSTLTMGTRPFKGTTDAITALRLGEASCNGKSRLFVALARAADLPARLVGGLVLSGGPKRTSHQWVEVYVAGHWVSFCPTNDYFSRLPASYLVLYRGDEALLQHTADIDFDYTFESTASMVPSPTALSAHGPLNVWLLFERIGLPFTLLRTLLMLPAGALVVVFFRNVVGMPTFGTFLPALIAGAAASTGLLWGMVGLLIVVVGVVGVRLLVQRLGLLHSPGLAILLTAVTIFLLATSLGADLVDLGSLARISLFPIAVLAITAERLYLSLAEQGPREAVRDMAGTMVVIGACYLVMNSLALQLVVLGFPEVLLLVVAGNIYLGRWTGVRMFEYVRFRGLLLPGPTA